MKIVAAALLGSCLLAQGVHAQSLFAGKQVAILVNYDAGGPTDLEARVLSRHIAKHLPGNPDMIVRNMGGAAGLVGAKYLGEVAPRDGLTMGYLTAATQRYVANPEKFSVDFRTYEFIAIVPSGRIHFMRADTPPGIKTAADVLKTKDIVVGGLGPDAPKDMAMRLTLDMLGVPYKYVTGYNSSAQAQLALQRGEIGYYADSPPIYNTKIEPLVRSGLLAAVFYDPGYDGTTFSVPKQMKGLPVLPFQELYRQAKGGEPSGQLWEAYKSLLTVNGAMYRLIALPPGAPKPVVDALRQAVLKLNDDASYIEEAQKTMGDAPEYISGPNFNEDVKKGLSIDPGLKTFMENYVKRAER